MEERRIVRERGAQLLLRLPVDLADAALGDAEDVADLAQREVLDVEQDRDLALGQEIPEQMWTAVAQVLAWAYGLSEKRPTPNR